MKRYLTTFVAVAMLVGLGLTIGCQRAVEPANEIVEPPPDVPPEDLAALVEGNNQFALDLYKKLAETEKGNIFFSPYSISSALAMTYAGARGQTAEEMAKVLHFTLPQQKLHAALGGLTKSLQTAGKNRRYQLNIANSIWAQRGMQLVPEFLDITKDSYGACVREVDFANSDAARDTINRWVEQQTDDKIKELLKAGDVDSSVRLVLTNAVYFRGNWKQQFDPTHTKPGNFETKPGLEVQVPMMFHEEMKVRTSQSPTFSLIEIPYVGGRYQMIFLLPVKRSGLREVEGTLTVEQLSAAIAQLKPSTMSIVVPRFQFRRSYSLNDELQKLGMLTPFSESSANFSGMTSSANIYISKVVHQASIEVDETGAIATAATAVVMREVSAKMPVRIDQPFVCLIRDASTDTILFLGRVSDPR